MKRNFTLLFILFAINASSQTTLVLYPDRDNTIYEDLPNNSNALGTNIFAGNTNNGIGYARRALLHFSLSGIPSGSTITSASLELYCNQSSSGSTIVSLNTITSNWGNGTSIGSGTQATGTSATTNDPTWNANFFGNSTWISSGGDFNTVASATSSVSVSNQTYLWNSTQMKNDVQSWLDFSATNYGWIVIGDESTNQTAKRFAALEDLTISNRPHLTIVYTAPLSVNIISFNSSIVNQNIILKWETASEENIKSFTVEHSQDGIEYYPITTINSKGTNGNYEYDYSTNDIGIHYFRLKVNDINGNSSFSKNTFIKWGNEENPISIIQNPVKNEIVLGSNITLQNQAYKIINLSGSIVRTGVIDGKTINANSLTKGLYYLVINKTILNFLKE